jgi:hypothetical protein
MPRFHLHRIQRMCDNPSAEKITPGLEAAAYLHWITCYELDPTKFTAVEPQLPELRRHLADYLALTKRETEAHLELMAATQPGGGEAVGTKDFQAAPVTTPPATPGPRVLAQFGLNWVFLYWDAATSGGAPWGYRVYRTDKKSAPVLVGTFTECEALLPEQPQDVKLYYYVTAFNAAGESQRSADFGLMLSALEEPEASVPQNSLPTSQPDVPKFPEHELPIRRELGAAMMEFVTKLGNTRLGKDEEDTVMRQVATEEYRQAVEKAARQNVEVSFAWHTLAMWTEDGKERIGYFARALECQGAENKSMPRHTAKERWAVIHTEASCLYEIGRVHFSEGSPEAARRFLTEALPLARQADALQAEAGATDDLLEGKIAELLLQLPDEDGGTAEG